MQLDEEIVRQRVEEFVALCRRQGLKATHQRTEIFRELAASDEHPDAEAIYLRVRERIPAISLDTVYRTLRLFEEKGIALRVASYGDRARFDAGTSAHQHFVCKKCGRVEDLFDAALCALPAPDALRELGAVEDVSIEFRGVCRDCQAA